jgi:hypothetical protein
MNIGTTLYIEHAFQEHRTRKKMTSKNKRFGSPS